MIDIESRDNVAVITFDHGKANALDLEFCQAVTAALPRLRNEATGIVVTGRGPIFSAGVDLLRVLDEGPTYVTEFLSALSGLCQALFGFPNPVVAAINGHAIAGGCVIACMADRRLMAHGGGRIGVPELLVGVPFPAAPLAVLQFAIPRQYLAEIIYGCDTYEPRAALERGLIDAIVDGDELLRDAIATVQKFSGSSPDAFRLTKAQLRRPVLERIQSASDTLDREVQEFWTRPETKTVIRSYVERTFKKPSP